jgi:taurine---2-oxoglutarate transaminase
MELPYFLTWSAQQNPVSFELDHTDEFHFVTAEGKKILDLTSVSFQTILGLKPKRLLSAIQKQFNNYPVCSTKALNNLKSDNAKNLLNMINLPGKIFYTVSGAESIENALKMAREIKGSKTVLARKSSYHGATLGAMSITGDWRNEAHATVDEWTVRIPEPYEDPECIQTEKIVNDIGAKNIAAFCLETVSAANGVIIPPQSWWNGIQKICKEQNIFLILDEVVMGFFRGDSAFGFQSFDLDPDFICLAKGISGGVFPLGAVFVKEKITRFYDNHILACGLTNYAHPLGLAVSNEVLNILCEESFQKKLNRLKKEFQKQIMGLKKIPNVQTVRVMGLIACIELKNSNKDFSYYFERGLHLFIKENKIILAPPYILGIKKLQEAMKQLGTLLKGDE